MIERPKVAVVLDTTKAYGQGLVDGIVAYLDDFHSFVPIFIQPFEDDSDPLPSDLANIEAAILWTSPVSEWVHRLIDAEKAIINCGPDWLHNPKVICMVADQGDDSHVAAAQHFSNLGLKRAYTATYEANFRPVMLERSENFVTCAKDLSMESEYFEATFGDPSGMGLVDLDKYEEMRAWLEGLEPPFGVWCEDDELAILCCRLVRSIGLAVPRDVAIIGTGDSLEGRFFDTPISSIPKKSDLIGFRAAQIATDIMEGDPSPDGIFKRTPLKVVARESTVGTHGEMEIEHVYRYIHRHACEGITVQELVSIAGVSKKTLIKRFSIAFGCDPSVEIRNVRLNKARDLLKHSSMSVSDVAKVCGFTSHSSFVNFFVRMESLSPAKYRKEFSSI